MTTAGKATVGGGTFAVGGSAAGVAIKNMMDMEPDATLLVSVENFDSTYTSGMLGSSDNNKNIFVDPDANQTWWEWVHKERISTVAESNEFKAVKSGYSTSSEEALNKVCRKAFVSQKSELVVIPYKKDIWRYCSKIGNIPEGIGERPSSTPATNSDTSKFTGKTSNKGKFVDSVEGNKEWWNWIYVNVFKPDKDDSSKQDDIHTDFKSITKGYSGTSGNDSLNQVCKTAYDKRYVEVVNINYKKNIWKYCSKDGNEPSDVSEKPTYTTITSIDETSKYGGVANNKSQLVDEAQTNEEWWNWIYENKFKPDKENTEKQSDLHDKFKSITKGYETSGNDSLNQVCKTAYGEKTVEVVNIKYKKNIWTYCSVSGTPPEGIESMPQVYVLSDAKSTTHTIAGSNKLGLVESNKSQLISNISDNEEGWNWIFENKLKADKQSDSKKNNIYSSFSSVTKGYSDDSSTDNTTALNLVCKTGYEQEEAALKDTSNNYKSSIEAYCRKSDATGNLTLPPASASTT